MFDVRRQDAVNFENIRKVIKADRKIKMLLGIPSTFENLGKYLSSCGDTAEMYNINTIICYGEALPKPTREKLKRVFGCNIVSLYSNQENGMLALECVENKEFQINNASYHIELSQIDTECSWNSHCFSSVYGQIIDFIYDTKGNKKYPHTISVLMGPFDKLLQYQFIQEVAKRYILKLNGSEEYYEDATFVDLFKGFLGQDSEVVIEHVNEIPVLASGKRKEVMNEYQKKERSWNGI